MNVNIDPDTTPDTYIEHRELLRIGDAGSFTPRRPNRIRIGSSTGATIEAAGEHVARRRPAADELALPPRLHDALHGPDRGLRALPRLATEFPNIAQLIPLPNATNGYQRRAQAMMDGTTPPGNGFPNAAAGQEAARAVVLTSRAWGHEGGNAISAEFVNPGAATRRSPSR